MDYSYGTAKDCFESGSVTEYKSWKSVQLQVDLIILGLESLLQVYTSRSGIVVWQRQKHRGWNRLRSTQNNRKGVLCWRSQEVAIGRAPRPNRINRGVWQLRSRRKSTEPSKGVTTLHQAQGQEARSLHERKCAATVTSDDQVKTYGTLGIIC